MTLGEVLEHANDHSIKLSLFLPMDEVWRAETRGILVELDPYDEEGENQEIEGALYALGLADVQSIVSNARQQIPDATRDQLVNAFSFYFDHDAFIDFSMIS